MATIHGSLGYRLVHGMLSYRCAAGERGQERFTISAHGDGSRILRAMSEIYETRVLRDVSLRIGADGCPRDAFVRITVNDRFRGSGWFCFEEDEAQGEALHAPASRVSQRVRAGGRVRSFGTHPITGDGWHAFLFDMHGPARQRFDRLMISSYAFDGTTGPELLPLAFGLELVGIEDVTVAAGTIRCRHFRFLLGDSEFHDHPPYDIWVTDDGDNVMVRAHVGAPKDYVYELVSLERIER
jgi:hypothetical protein